MKLKLFFLCFITCAFVGCFDMTDTITINNDGSGLFEQKMDFTRAITSFNEIKALRRIPEKTSKIPQKKDSIIFYKSIVDTLSSLSEKEKIVMRNAYAKLHIDEAQSEMVVSIFYPFVDAEAFNMIQEIISRKTGGTNFMDQITSAIKSNTLKDIAGMENESNKKDDGRALQNSNYRYNLQNNKISRILINSESFVKDNEFKSLPEQFKEMLKLSYNSIIHFPKPANIVLTKNGTLSNENKTFKINKEVEIAERLEQDDFEFIINFN